MKSYRIFLFALVFGLGVTCATAAHSWMADVPETYRNKVNPYAGQNEAVAGGAKLYATHCEKCHGPSAAGTRGRPSLRTPEVQQAADGTIFWLLKNGNRYRGMPSWNSLPEASRWQLVAFIKSLNQTAAGASAIQPREDK